MKIEHDIFIYPVFRLLLIILAVTGPVVYAAGGGRHTEGRTAELKMVLSRSLLLGAAVRGTTRVVVGDRGHILVAHKEEPWRLAATPTAATLTAVYFHDEKLGWAAGHDAVILKTVDGGRHWRQVYSDPDRDSPILDIWFADRNQGIAIGAYGLYLVTTNGGETWNEVGLHIINPEAEKGLDATAGVPAGGGTMEQYDLHLNRMAAAGSGRLYIAAEAGHLYRSDDMGLNWREVTSPYHGSWFGILPLAEKSLLVFGLRGHLFRSDDAGNSWKEIATHTNETLTGGILLQDGTVVISGMGGVVLCSRDRGRTFTLSELPYKHDHAALLEAGPDRLIFAGDHGLEAWYKKDLGLAHD